MDESLAHTETVASTHAVPSCCRHCDIIKPIFKFTLLGQCQTSGYEKAVNNDGLFSYWNDTSSILYIHDLPTSQGISAYLCCQDARLACIPVAAWRLPKGRGRLRCSRMSFITSEAVSEERSNAAIEPSLAPEHSPATRLDFAGRLASTSLSQSSRDPHSAFTAG